MSKESGTEDVDWWLTGSAALAIRHVAVVPRDIDLVVETGEDAEKLGEALSNWLVEHVQRSEGWLHGGLEDLSKLLELNVLEKWKLGLIFQNRATSAQ